MVRSDRWLHLGMMAVVASAGPALMFGCGEDAPAPFDPTKRAEAKKQHDVVRAKERGLKSIERGKGRSRVSGRE
jgi:hypothetical protein